MKSNSHTEQKATPIDSRLKKPLRPKKTLKELQVGDVAQIVEFSNPNDMSKKIEAMGLRRGKQVEVLQRLGRGILVKTNNSRIVITSDLAKNIEVK